LLGLDFVDYIGEVSEPEKSGFLGGAHALLLPIDWPEPFGLVMIEAMACGTPVIAFRQGSVPEIVEHGVTGFIVDSIKDAMKAVEKLHTLDRSQIRRRFEERFSSEIMTQNYESLYHSLIAARTDRIPEKVYHGRTPVRSAGNAAVSSFGGRGAGRNYLLKSDRTAGSGSG
jgi:glycosyltransferase involved in cell wall biosynthesis